MSYERHPPLGYIHVYIPHLGILLHGQARDRSIGSFLGPPSICGSDHCFIHPSCSLTSCKALYYNLSYERRPSLRCTSTAWALCALGTLLVTSLIHKGDYCSVHHVTKLSRLPPPSQFLRSPMYPTVSSILYMMIPPLSYITSCSSSHRKTLSNFIPMMSLTPPWDTPRIPSTFKPPTL